MAFDWSVIGIKEITSLFLYGTFFPPTDKATETLIRPAGASPTPIDVNMSSFMASGPGRFALGSRSPLIQTFFDSAFDTSWMQPGVRYDKVTFQNTLLALGVSNANSDFLIRQSLLDDGSSDQDYRLRSYVWNSGLFELSNDAEFVVDAAGNRSIVNYLTTKRGQIYFPEPFIGVRTTNA